MMPKAAARLDRWRAGAGDAASDAAVDLKGLVEVRDLLDDDLDTPAALAAVDDAVARGEGVRAAAALLGVDLTASSGS
jgi:L-cysteine:1D-myo-inositol 2-amino-2-deoxy-alpha-D-glucopyranoside ligase